MKKIVLLLMVSMVHRNFAQTLPVGQFKINNDGIYNTSLSSGGVSGIDMGFDGATGFVKFGAHTGNGYRNDILYMRGSDGNVGIGTSSPLQKLDVNGHAIIKGAIISAMGGDEGGQIQIKNDSKTSNGIANSWVVYNMTGGYGNSLQFWAYDNLGCGAGGLCSNRFTIMDNGNVGIGVNNPNNKLDVNGTIHSKEVKVDTQFWSDFVFKKEYELPTLSEVEKHIKEKGHLRDIPSEEEVMKNGINLGEMDAKLLQKIEELTLYLIEMKKDINSLKEENQELKSKLSNN
ncbi:hypothetical protein [Flavobacterium branchiicola]|uniref:Uncharacterized protein n=1 Tax=Flavobacterium branchiicola TaxID=1114875 RepID=A0ABV9PNN2_9FLAO|nr:hypothetical protein [Flavobacterium branchiicola]MBS7256708.1 hypothetical protein [Flavobacterium branchiicola]